MQNQGATCSRQAFIASLTSYLADKQYTSRGSADGTSLSYSFDRKEDADYVAHFARLFAATVEEYNYGGRSNLTIKGFTR